MKTFTITDANNGQKLASIQARDAKSALKKFLRSHCMYTGMYEIHQTLGVWTLSSSYGAYFTAREEKKP